MRISGLQKVSLVDFDGHIATTIFTAGCNFACPFCHNSGLISNKDTLISESEILDHLEKRKNVIDSVCISGGEPTLNLDLPQFISKIKNMGYTIKLDTNGSNLDVVKKLVETNLVNYIAMDIKNSLNKYNITINSQHTFDIKSTIEYIMSCGIDYEFRTTLIEGLHTEQDIIEMGKLIHGAKKLYLQKFVDSENCLQRGLSPIDKSIAEHYLDILKKHVKEVHLRGY